MTVIVDEILIDTGVVLLKCPVCDWLLLPKQREYSRHDYYCPGCGLKKQSEFEVVAGFTHIGGGTY